MNLFFVLDKRLGIQLPDLKKEWEEYTDEEQQSILVTWEKIRGRIPDRIAEIETKINQKQSELGEENDFNRSCELNSEISELASMINDLWLWYRLNQTVTDKVHF
ncbi:hypothetical protein ACFSCX_22920 [Bacillus salitolerans]|uniref:Radical SAM protein n=1 Tax=Bacillus salitolerans TaxID=1437434 RepID=A0ABW4LW63_9BACI